MIGLDACPRTLPGVSNVRLLREPLPDRATIERLREMLTAAEGGDLVSFAAAVSYRHYSANLFEVTNTDEAFRILGQLEMVRLRLIEHIRR